MGGAVKAVVKVVKAVVSNPLPIIETVALTAVGVPPIVANAAVTAANGGSVGDIALSAASTVAGTAAGQAAGEAATSAGATQEVAKIAASAVGQSTKSLIQTGDITGALGAGVVAGGTTAAIDVINAAAKQAEIGKGTTTTTPTDTGTSAPSPTATGAAGTATIPTSPYGTTEAVTPTSPFGTTGTVNLPSIDTSTIGITTGIPAGTIPSATGKTVPTSPYGTTEQVTATSPYGTTGTVSQPSFDYPSTTYTPSFWESDTGKALASAGQGALQAGISSSLADIFGLTPSTKTAQTTPTSSTGSTITTTGQGASPGSQALAQALRVDPGATLGGGDQKAPQNVWNLASLRVKDETGS